MIGLFRSFLNTRVARIFFVLLVIPFVMWGIADVARNMGTGTQLATVGSRRIEPGEFQDAFRRQLAQVTRAMGAGTEPTPEMRRGIAGQTLDQLLTQAAIANEVQAMGLVAPDAAVRRVVFEMPAFRGPGGTFDRRQFDQVLRQNNLGEPRFLELMRGDIAAREVLDTVSAGVRAPDVLVAQVFAFQHETRTADLVELPLAAAPEPAAPTEDDLRRAYEDDPQRYSAPAYKHVKMVVLTPDTVGRTLQVTDADVDAYLQAHRGEIGSAEKRSVQVLVAPDEAAAGRLAAQWQGGADWAAMQKAAAEAGGSAVEIDNSAKDGLPGAELADAAFAAAPDAVVGPVKGAFGFQVLRVVHVVPGTMPDEAALRAEARTRLLRDKAADEMAARATQLDDAISSSGSLDQIPAEIGAAAVAGNLDAEGNTKEGGPAPIPGTPALRSAILQAVQVLAVGAPPTLREGPDGSYYAVVVDGEDKAEVKPFAEVEDQVRENWLHDARRHAEEEAAARLLSEVKNGKTLDDAAVVAGLRAERTAPLNRNAPAEGVAPQVVAAAFALRPGEATMVETPDGFVVAQLAGVEAPPPSSDPVGAEQLRTALGGALGQDMVATYVTAVRNRARPTVNKAMLDQIVQ